jgi:tetratricopeptide (TPR) repeat protein
LLGQCYEAGRKDDLAITAYTTAMKMNPLAASACHNMELLYIKSAEHYLKQDYPESVKDSVKLFKGAQRFLEKALEIGGHNPMFLHSVASWYEKYTEVLEKITEEVEAVQKNIDNNFELATLYYEKA